LAKDSLILIGERRLLHVLKEFAAHYHEERDHQGLGNDLIAPTPRAVGRAGIRCRDRLGGLFRYYYHAA
jgi:putative transposase